MLSIDSEQMESNIPVESLIYQNQKAYYETLQASTYRTDSALFIEFILQMVLGMITRNSTQIEVDLIEWTISDKSKSPK